MRGRARFLPQEKGALPLKPASQIINETKTGPSLEETAPFRIVGAVVDAGKRGTGAAGTAPNAAIVAAPCPMLLCFERRKVRGPRLSKSVWGGEFEERPACCRRQKGPFLLNIFVP